MKLTVFYLLCDVRCGMHGIEDPFRGCVNAGKGEGPRRSGDFVVLGCMQV